jgi:hypothetical protein
VSDAVLLKENRTTMAIGAKRNTKTRSVYRASHGAFLRRRNQLPLKRSARDDTT